MIPQSVQQGDVNSYVPRTSKQLRQEACEVEGRPEARNTLPPASDLLIDRKGPLDRQKRVQDKVGILLIVEDMVTCSEKL